MIKFTVILLLLAMTVLCEKAETKDRGWYSSQHLLRLAGFFAGAALMVAFI